MGALGDTEGWIDPAKLQPKFGPEPQRRKGTGMVTPQPRPVKPLYRRYRRVGRYANG